MPRYFWNVLLIAIAMTGCASDPEPFKPTAYPEPPAREDPVPALKGASKATSEAALSSGAAAREIKSTVAVLKPGAGPLQAPGLQRIDESADKIVGNTTILTSKVVPAIDASTIIIELLKADNASMRNTNQKLNADILAQQQSHISEMAKLRDENAKALTEQQERHAGVVKKIHDDNAETIKKLEARLKTAEDKVQSEIRNRLILLSVIGFGMAAVCVGLAFWLTKPGLIAVAIALALAAGTLTGLAIWLEQIAFYCIMGVAVLAVAGIVFLVFHYRKMLFKSADDNELHTEEVATFKRMFEEVVQLSEHVRAQLAEKSPAIEAKIFGGETDLGQIPNFLSDDTIDLVDGIRRSGAIRTKKRKYSATVDVDTSAQ